jgi:hypothetical protein
MTKKEQAAEAMKGIAPQLNVARESIAAARLGFLAFHEGDERQAVREAYAENVVPACRELITELTRFVTTIEGD